MKTSRYSFTSQMGTLPQQSPVGTAHGFSLENHVALSILSGRTLGHSNFTSRKSTVDFIPWVYLQVFENYL